MAAKNMHRRKAIEKMRPPAQTIQPLESHLQNNEPTKTGLFDHSAEILSDGRFARSITSPNAPNNE